MGLDIIAFKNLIPVSVKYDKDGYPIGENLFIPGSSMDWSEKHFPGRGAGINSTSVYTYEDTFDFHAGSYSYYNIWRDLLAKFVLEIHEDNAFYELIHFADNEGVIGPIVSAKLYLDFKNNYDKAKEYNETINLYSPIHISSWFEQYENWLKAFEFASENGAIEFC